MTMPSDASFNDKHHQWQLTRRQLISRSAAAGVAIAAPGFLSACGGDGEGEGEGDDGKAKAEQFADQHIADHMGDAGSTLWESRITNSAYTARLEERAQAFR
jgi:hypothetical protein